MKKSDATRATAAILELRIIFTPFGVVTYVKAADTPVERFPTPSRVGIALTTNYVQIIVCIPYLFGVN